jgi:hypothetical protein
MKALQSYGCGGEQSVNARVDEWKARLGAN